ncbi:MAG TPA: elongation factor 1-beta [Candidatus Aenigmarchaeota archaeon]|nr:elongation factor 1-beta [Candidatus Aenigmarchaeota archaeon]
MGQVALTLNVMPENTEVNLAQLKQRIQEAVEPQQIVEKPIGFGLVMLEVLLVFDDKKGAGIDFEGVIREIEGVGSVESGNATLI